MIFSNNACKFLADFNLAVKKQLEKKIVSLKEWFKIKWKYLKKKATEC